MNKRLFNDTVLELKARIESYKENDNYQEKEEHKDALTPEDLYEEPLYEVADYNLKHISYVGPFGDADGSFAWLFCFLVLFSLGFWKCVQL